MTILDIQKLKKPEIIEETGWFSEYNQGWNECLSYLSQKGYFHSPTIPRDVLRKALTKLENGAPEAFTFKTVGEYFMGVDIYNSSLDTVLAAVYDYLKLYGGENESNS